MKRLCGIWLAALLVFLGCAEERLAGKGAASETTTCSAHHGSISPLASPAYGRRERTSPTTI